jgi:hypothetical protein
MDFKKLKLIIPVSSYIKMDSLQTASLKLTFTLEKKAKSAGGDKYVCTSQPEFNIYVPQTISRSNNVPKTTLDLTFT